MACSALDASTREKKISALRMSGSARDRLRLPGSARRIEHPGPPHDDQRIGSQARADALIAVHQGSS
jgi:hypothetical protein